MDEIRSFEVCEMMCLFLGDLQRRNYTVNAPRRDVLWFGHHRKRCGRSERVE